MILHHQLPARPIPLQQKINQIHPIPLSAQINLALEMNGALIKLDIKYFFSSLVNDPDVEFTHNRVVHFYGKHSRGGVGVYSETAMTTGSEGQTF